MKLKSLFKSGLKFASENKANILTAAAIVLEAGAIIAAFKAGPKCNDILDEIEDREANGETVSKKEKAVEVGKTLVLPVGLGIASAGCAIASNRIDAKTIATLNSTIQVGQTAYAALMHETKKAVGEEKANDIQKNVTKETNKAVKAVEYANVVHSGHGTELMQETITGQYLYGCSDWIEGLVDAYNDSFIVTYHSGYQSGDGDPKDLTELYESMGLKWNLEALKQFGVNPDFELLSVDTSEAVVDPELGRAVRLIKFKGYRPDWD